MLGLAVRFVDTGSDVNTESVSLTGKRHDGSAENLETEEGLRQFTWPIEITSLHYVAELFKC
jgi:hypothetical protein